MRSPPSSRFNALLALDKPNLCNAVQHCSERIAEMSRLMSGWYHLSVSLNGMVEEWPGYVGIQLAAALPSE